MGAIKNNILKIRTWRISKNAPRFAVPAIIFTVICIATLSGFFEARDLALMDMRFRLLERAPSDTLIIVEIDPYSLQEEERWPWPRNRYANAVANLQDAGAGLIAIDVDFSSLSEKAGDAAFAAQLSARPGEVILPVFSQWSSHAGSKRAIIQTPPHTYFLKDAVMASVNLTPERNGIVRRGWRHFGKGADYQATLAATLADAPSMHNEGFYIDYSIDPSKIRRLSFNDVLHSNFPKESVAGKNILIGATALELGDEFASPVRGVVPGVVLHALSYESLRQDRAVMRPHAAVTLTFALVIILCFCRSGRDRRWRAAARLHFAVFTASIVGPTVLQAVVPISFDMAAPIAAQILCIIYVTFRELHERAKHLIRHRLATARSHALTSLVVSSNSDGVIVAAASGAIELCNDRAKELLDIKDEVTPNALITDLAPGFPLCPEIRNSGDIGVNATSAALPHYFEFALERRPNQVLEIVAASAPYGDGKADDPDRSASHVYVYTVRDISERKRIEAAEKAVKEDAIAANKLKSQLISNISHELRTPLNGVIGFADLMQKESFGPLGVSEYKEFSESIYVSGKRLLSVVNDMLSIAKLDTRDYQLSKEVGQIDEIIEHSIDNFAAQISDRDRQVSIEISEDISALNIDFNVVREMLLHLIANALKFSGDDPRIVIRAMLQINDLVIEVEDNGCGVDPQLLPNLTQAFYQADSALSRQHEGAGLGLYIVEKLVNLHEGSVEFVSSKGAGFTARLRFHNIAVQKSRCAA